jgi:hypothetical protein
LSLSLKEILCTGDLTSGSMEKNGCSFSINEFHSSLCLALEYLKIIKLKGNYFSPNILDLFFS